MMLLRAGGLLRPREEFPVAFSRRAVQPSATGSLLPSTEAGTISFLENVFGQEMNSLYPRESSAILRMPGIVPLQELRRARELTQVRMAKTLGISQDSVSRLEKRSDLLLSTLRKTVQAMGGNLSLVAEFPDRAPVILSGIVDGDPLPSRRRRPVRA